MKPKYQDTVKDYRPTIPLKSIKQKYTPTQSYVSQDNRSNWQHEQDAEMADRAYKQQMEDRKMQEGLHNLNGFLTFTDYAGLATGVGGLVSKGLKWGGKQVAKRIVRNKNLGIVPTQFQGKSDVTDRFIKFAGGRRNEPSIDITKIRGIERLQAQKLQESGVDMSRITKSHLESALGQREMLLKKYAPEGRFNIIKPNRHTDIALDVLDYNKSGGREVQVGNTRLLIDKSKHISIGGTNNTSTNPVVHKVEERGLNSAIQLSNQSGLNGVITGADLKSAPKTYNVWKYFKDKELFDNYGTHSNTNMISEGIEKGKIKVTPDIDNETIINNISQMRGDATRRLTLPNAPVYKLTRPSNLPTKTKSIIFDPSIIDKQGVMHIDWNNSDIYKILAPFMATTSLSTKKDGQLR